MPHPMHPAPRAVRAAAITLAFLSLAACAGGGVGGGGRATVFDVDRDRPFQEAELRGAGRMPLEVLGVPPDGSGPDEVAAAMTLPGRLGGGRMEPVAPGAGGSRFVVSFFPARARQLCAGGGAAAAESASGDRLRMGFAWCRNDRLLIGAQLRSADISGPSDPGFRNAVLQLYGMTVGGGGRPGPSGRGGGASGGGGR